MLSEMCGKKEELKDMEEKVEVTHELGSYQRRMINCGECNVIKTLSQTMSVEEISNAIKNQLKILKGF